MGLHEILNLSNRKTIYSGDGSQTFTFLIGAEEPRQLTSTCVTVLLTVHMMRYDFTIFQVNPLLTADTLSRTPLVVKPTETSELRSLVESFVDTVVSSLPASSHYMKRIQVTQTEDLLLSQVMKFCEEGWPAKHAVKGRLKLYWNVCSELSLCNQLLLHCNRNVIPAGLQQKILNCIHQGHQGIT